MALRQIIDELTAIAEQHGDDIPVKVGIRTSECGMTLMGAVVARYADAPGMGAARRLGSVIIETDILNSVIRPA